nr:Transposase and inactivated derivatives [Klebsiella pneumoniae]
MFVIGAAPVLLLPFIYFCVEESPVWQAAGRIKRVRPCCRYCVATGSCACTGGADGGFQLLLSRDAGSLPGLLKVQHGFEPKTVSIIAVCYNIASIIGGVFFGSLSEKIGRRKAIMIAALLALPVIPLWAFASGSLALGRGVPDAVYGPGPGGDPHRSMNWSRPTPGRCCPASSTSWVICWLR